MSGEEQMQWESLFRRLDELAERLSNVEALVAQLDPVLFVSTDAKTINADGWRDPDPYDP